MTALNDRFWAKVLFKEFIKHFRKLSDKERLEDIEASMDALEDLDDSGNSFGSKMVRWSMDRVNQYPNASENGKKGGRPRKNENSGSAKPSTDGDTRKDSLNITNSSNGVLLESATSVEKSYAQALDCLHDKASDQGEDNTADTASGRGPEPDNLYGDALSSDASDGESPLSTESHADRTTVSQNATEDAATREGAVNNHDAPSGQTRCGMLESGTSSVAKFNDKNMRRVPQNEAPAHGFSGGRTAQGTMSRSPEAAAQSGKVYDQGTIEISTNDKKGTGTGPVREKKVPVPDVLSLAYSGEFGNVKLTQEQYAELGIKFGNLMKLNRAIDSLSCKLVNNELTPVPKNHYAVLVKWAAYRDDMEEQNRQEDSAPKMTEMEKSWIRESEKIARYEKEIANERR